MHNVAKWELNTFTEFQKKLHGKGGKVTLRFQLEVKRASWGTNVVEKIEGTGSELPDGTSVVYPLNDKFDYIMFVYLQLTIPFIKVHDKWKGNVEICWTHNLFHNIFREGHFRKDSESIQRSDKVWLDNHAMCFIGMDQRPMYLAKAGNIRALTKWNTHLPRMSLKLPQKQWFYAKHRRVAFPLFECTNNVVDHQYKFNLDIKALLRMRIRKDADSPWKYVDYDSRVVIGPKADGKLSIPELFGRYASITEEEKKHIRTNSSREIYYDDIVSIDPDTEYQYGDTPSFELNTIYPCKAIFFNAENQQAIASRYMSNYSTNSEDHLEGWNPIVSAGLTYGADKRVPELFNDHFDYIEPFFCLDTIPTEPGYNMMILAFDLPSVYGDVGSMLVDKAKLIIRLGETVLYDESNSHGLNAHGWDHEDLDVSEKLMDLIEKKDTSKTTFKIKIRLIVQRHLEFGDDGKIKLDDGRVEL